MIDSINILTSPSSPLTLQRRQASSIVRACMGVKHATLRRSRSPSPQECSAQLPRSSSFAERLLPRCLMPENAREDDDGDDHGAERGGKGRLPTLEEWLLDSPGVEVQHRRQSPKVCPLSPSVVGCDRRFAGVVDVSAPSVSGRRRRVSFRLPVEGDIIVISSTTDCESN